MGIRIEIITGTIHILKYNIYNLLFIIARLSKKQIAFIDQIRKIMIFSLVEHLQK